MKKSVVISIGLLFFAAGFAVGFAVLSDHRSGQVEGIKSEFARDIVRIEKKNARARADSYKAGYRNGKKDGFVSGKRAGFERGFRMATKAENSFKARQKLAGAGAVLAVGDSIQLLTAPYLEEAVKRPIEIVAEGGFNSFQIYDLFEQNYNPKYSVVVFDSGTNDNPAYPEILDGEIKKVAETIGPDRCLVLPTVHGLTVSGIDSGGKNQVVRKWGKTRDMTLNPNWAYLVETRPDLMQSDDLHPNEDGAYVRALLLKKSISSCFSQQLN